MKGGRKNLKRAAEEAYTFQEGQCVMQVVSLRGSNLIEIMDDKGEKSLAIFPAKFQKSMWIKRGSFVVIDERGRDMALESGSKVTCIVSQVLFHEQLRVLQKSPEWPDVFRTVADNSNDHLKTPICESTEELNSSDDDLPPIEENLNRRRPMELPSDSDTDSETTS
ncbi:hypothetical protein IFM89_025360 [Coptis chinensis]|uniref:S1-like domain-containing protein n=1 Tax=Coptis chinensis TaxID=261450 RepID=A0A835HEZ3_9MAGN|nr:hypothetical protein IFM89_005364 [Coptis chinensis]KAF9598124.1 hypothetical protein IFM89_025360 [Coptis chinensis]